MTRWISRPPDMAALFNPALLAVMCAGLAEGWESETGEALPLVLAPSGCAMLLSARARERLPSTRRTRLGPWIEEHGPERVEVARLAFALSPRVREAIRVGLREGLLQARAPGVHGKTPRTLPSDLSPETETVLKRTAWVGGWLAQGGSPLTILALLGAVR